MNRMIASLTAAALLILVTGTSQAEAEKPDATIAYTGTSLGLGLGYTWGHGVLHYQGMDYPFSANGLTAATVGGAWVTASGNVHNLTKVEDFPGRFVAAAAGGAAGDYGAGWTALRNENGVVVQLKSASEGLELTLAVGSFNVAFSGPPTPSAGASMAAGGASR